MDDKLKRHLLSAPSAREHLSKLFNSNIQIALDNASIIRKIFEKYTNDIEKKLKVKHNTFIKMLMSDSELLHIENKQFVWPFFHSISTVNYDLNEVMIFKKMLENESSLLNSLVSQLYANCNECYNIETDVKNYDFLFVNKEFSENDVGETILFDKTIKYAKTNFLEKGEFLAVKDMYGYSIIQESNCVITKSIATFSDDLLCYEKIAVMLGASEITKLIDKSKRTTKFKFMIEN